MPYSERGKLLSVSAGESIVIDLAIYLDGLKKELMLRKYSQRTIKVYLETYHPAKWLFPGQKDGMHITTRTVQMIFEDAIKKRVLIRMLVVVSTR